MGIGYVILGSGYEGATFPGRPADGATVPDMAARQRQEHRLRRALAMMTKPRSGRIMGQGGGYH